MRIGTFHEALVRTLATATLGALFLLSSTSSASTADETTTDALAKAVSANAEAPAAPTTSFTISLNQDNFWGLFPQVGGTIPLTDDFGITFGGILWANVVGASGGVSYWTEVGVGVSYSLLDGALAFAPMFTTVLGQRFAARGDESAERNTIIDGLLPNLTVTYSDDRFDGEVFAAYYRAVGGGSGVFVLNDFIQGWAWAGVKLHEFVSIGAHYEMYRAAQSDGVVTDFYQWLGGYAEVKLAGDVAVRLTAGHDLIQPDDFMKIRVAKTF